MVQIKRRKRKQKCLQQYRLATILIIPACLLLILFTTSSNNHASNDHIRNNGNEDTKKYANNFNSNSLAAERVEREIDDDEDVENSPQVVDHHRHEEKVDEHWHKGHGIGKRLPHKQRILRPKRKQKELPEHCNSTSSTVKEILIRGERHSGTNWIRSILVQNIPGGGRKGVKLRNDSRLYGWKHGFLPPLGWGNPLSGDAHLLFVITRDVFTWLPKMYEESYDRPMNLKRNLTFSEFLRTDYEALCHPTFSELHPIRHRGGEKEGSRGFMEEQLKRGERKYLKSVSRNVSNQVAFCSKLLGDGEAFDFSTSITERAKNIVQIRTQKYKQWLSNDPDDGTYIGSRDTFLENRIHLKLESLSEPVNVNSNSISNNDNSATLEDRIRLQEDILGKALDDHCLMRYDDFQGISTHQKWSKTWHKRKGVREKVFDAVEERRKLLNIYSEDDLKFVLSQLDIEFERQIGYDYSFMLEDFL